MKKHLDLKVILAGIFIVALVLRLIAAVEYSNKHKILTPCDQRAYDAIAVSLLDRKSVV